MTRRYNQYNYYESKEALIDDILSHFGNGYKHYIDWLSDVSAKAESLEELMDIMFNLGKEPPIDYKEMYGNLRKFLTSALIKGV